MGIWTTEMMTHLRCDENLNEAREFASFCFLRQMRAHKEVARDGLRDTMACHDRRIQWPYAGKQCGVCGSGAASMGRSKNGGTR